MYRLLLVDDEMTILQGMNKVIPFESLGFTVVGNMANGLEAFQKCEELRPDLVITDIRMPMMDGLTMCREIRKLLPMTRFVILSGYDDFEYAQQAIDAKVMKYLLKPISSAKMICALQEIKESMDQELLEHQDAAKIQKLFEQSLPFMRENVLCSLIMDETSAAEKMSNIQDYGISLSAEKYILALAQIANESKSIEMSGLQNTSMLRLAVRNIANEVVTDMGNVHLFGFDQKMAMLFLGEGADMDMVNETMEKIEQLKKTVSYYLKADLAVGISAPCSQLEQLPRSKEQAVTALQQSLFGGAEEIILYSDMKTLDTAQATVDRRILNELGNAVKICDDNQAYAIIEQLVEQMQQIMLNSDSMRLFLMDIILELLHIIHEENVDIDLNKQNKFVRDILSYQWNTCPSASQVRDELKKMCSQVMSAIDMNRISAQKKAIVRALEYMKAHFCEENMTLERIAHEVYLSKSHFSMIFKKETQKTFHQMLNEMRMEKAMQLLLSTNMKNFQIAEQVGISDSNYFSYAFKRHFGCSPSSVKAKSTETK